MKKPQVLAVVGAQYGSEGKGNFVHYLANDYNAHVRVGGPNAGHTIYHKGEKFVQQSLPCGWTNPAATLVIGAGALIDEKRLLVEIATAEKAMPGVRARLIVDPKAAVILDKHRKDEGGTAGKLHERIGSTGEGVGAVRMEKLRRRQSFVRAQNLDSLQEFLGDTVKFLYDHRIMGGRILLEGTQGMGLSMTHGPFPYTTSADTGPAQLAADCGIPPSLVSTLLVARTYPIRVAGNSGPMVDEINFDIISERMGRKTVERTTVTKKVRRIGLWDDQLFIRSALMSHPSSVALSFVDYLSPKDEGATKWTKLSDRTHRFVRMVEVEAGCPVSLIGTGGPACTVIER